MPKYKITDPDTKETLVISGDSPPSQEDAAFIFSSRKAAAPTGKPKEKGFWETLVSNIPGSAVEYGKAIIQPVIHPIDTVSNLANTLKGVDIKLRKLWNPVPQTPEEAKHDEKYEQAAEAAGDYFKQRYGSVENLRNTIEKDPVGFSADLSVFLTGGGTAISKIGPLAKVGAGVARVGKAMEPVSVASKVASPIVKPIVKGAGAVARKVVGVTTGVGEEAIKRAYKGSKEFTEGMRKTQGEDILTDVDEALGTVKEQMQAEYLRKFDKISKMKQPLDISPVYRKMDQLMESYGIRIDKNGELDFTRSTLNRNAVNDVKQIIETIKEWGKEPGDFTVKGLDTLKRQLDDFYSPSKNSRAFVQGLRTSLKDVIVRNVPEYASMTKGYAEVSKMINEVKKALSLGDRASADTAIRKLTKVLRENNEFRMMLISKLPGGEGILDRIAGYSMQRYMPQSFLGRSVAAGEIFSSIYKPQYLVGLLVASPRVVAEFLKVLGKGVNEYQELVKTGKAVPMRQAAFQVGREKEVTEEGR
jgi:hypothetical protein